MIAQKCYDFQAHKTYMLDFQADILAYEIYEHDFQDH